MLIMRCAFLPARFVFGAGVMILLPVKALAGTEVHPAAAVGAYKDTGEKSLPFSLWMVRCRSFRSGYKKAMTSFATYF